MDQVHSPQGGPWTGSTGVVHGPGSMFCIRPVSSRVGIFMCLIVTYCDYSYEKIHQLCFISFELGSCHCRCIFISVFHKSMTSLMLPSSELLQNLHRIKFC